MKIALINPNTNADTTMRMIQIAAPHFPGQIDGLTAGFGSTLITTEDALDTAGKAVLALQPKLEGYQAVVVSAFGDPGQEALAKALSMPVVGIAQAAMGEASAIASRFCVVTTTPGLVARIAQRASELGHGSAFAGTWITPGDPVALTADPDRLLAALHDATVAALSDDPAIEAVIIGGGPLAEAAKALAAQVPVPIVQPIPAALRLVQLSLSTQDLHT